ncbi:MAG: NAD(P)/FAD-dependent oxidoreductase [Methanobacterium sp.]
MTQKQAILIGAGPAGLTAAYELLYKTDIKPIIFEATKDIGGISKTVNYKGNRIDIGGHRFFSKSEKIMQWWLNILPLQEITVIDEYKLKNETRLQNITLNPEETDKMMLKRKRISRIFYLRKFFDYPLTLNINLFSNLGAKRTIKIGLSYLKTTIKPIKDEKTLEDFFINRFGEELYQTFFKDYTEKVWGVPCQQIKSDWGSQRIKGLSITQAVKHGLKNVIIRNSNINQKNVETSLIGQFMYPKYGPGQMWEEVARLIEENNGEIHRENRVIELLSKDNEIIGVKVRNEKTGELKTYNADYFISTMPVKDLIESFKDDISPKVREVAEGLVYRDFMTVGLLLKKLKIKNESKIKTFNDLIPDNWIYVQERDVKLGRIQIFNNWSPYLVENDENILLGLEYFVNEGDEYWTMNDDDFINYAIQELSRMDMIDENDVLDGFMVRMPKTYPAYFGTYDRFDIIRNFVDKFENLFLIGRNGMHRYNNMDHSMLSAMEAVENIINNVTVKDNIWLVNAEEDYHEDKK